MRVESGMPAPIAFQDCADCPEMLVIPPGSFRMGTAPGEEERENLSAEFRHRSEPRRAVNIARFAVGRVEVTRGQYRNFAETTGRDGNGCFAWSSSQFELQQHLSWRNPGYAQDDRHPVACVSWEDAGAYLRWLSHRTGKTYRLLSEAEWEYAARAGTETARFWGDDGNRSCEYANGADRSTAASAGALGIATCNDGYTYTAPAGSYSANAFGLHDMLGNVGEWTQDCWNRDYTGAPSEGRAVLTGDCTLRAVRGGAWDDAPIGLRAAYRVGSPTTVRLYSRGFRVARDF